MHSSTPTPESILIYSLTKKFWVQIKDHGEIAMSATKFEFTTSFIIEGESTFIMVDGKSFFIKDEIFVLWNFNSILVHYLNENQTFHLKAEKSENRYCYFEFKSIDTESPLLLITLDDQSIQTVEFRKYLGIFNSGKGGL